MMGISEEACESSSDDETKAPSLATLRLHESPQADKSDLLFPRRGDSTTSLPASRMPTSALPIRQGTMPDHSRLKRPRCLLPAGETVRCPRLSRHLRRSAR